MASKENRKGRLLFGGSPLVAWNLSEVLQGLQAEQGREGVNEFLRLQVGMGQILTTRGPQVLVLGSIHQAFIWGPVC